MSDLRELLHQAAPRPEARPDLDAIQGRVASRRRRRRAVLGAVVVLLAGAGLATAATVSDGGQPTVVVDDPDTGVPVPDGPLPAGITPVEVPGPPLAVAIGPGAVWVVGGLDRVPPVSYVARLDPSTGAVTASAEFDARVGQLAMGESVVWAYGQSIVAIDPTTATVIDTYLDGAVPASAAVTSGDVLWVSVGNSEAVAAFTVEEGRIVEQLVRPLGGQPADIVATDDGLLWVRVGDEIVGVESGTGAVVARFTWTGPLLAASQDGMVWTSDGSRLVELLPGALSEGASVALGGARIPVAASTVAVDEGGIWVGGADGVFRFAAGDLEAVAPVPVATLPLDDGAAPTSLATDGAAVWLTVDGLYRWAP